MPLTAKGNEIMSNMEKQYGSENKAKEVFYASKNKGTITGVDARTWGVTKGQHGEGYYVTLNGKHTTGEIYPTQEKAQADIPRVKQIASKWDARRMSSIYGDNTNGPLDPNRGVDADPQSYIGKLVRIKGGKNAAGVKPAAGVVKRVLSNGKLEVCGQHGGVFEIDTGEIMQPGGQDAEGEYKKGDRVHLGLAVPGGAGFPGVITNITPHEVHILHANGKTYKGSPKNLTKDSISQSEEGHPGTNPKSVSGAANVPGTKDGGPGSGPQGGGASGAGPVEKYKGYTVFKTADNPPMFQVLSGSRVRSLATSLEKAKQKIDIMPHKPGGRDEEQEMRSKPMTRAEREHHLRKIEADAAHEREMEAAKANREAEREAAMMAHTHKSMEMKAQNDAAHIMKDYDYENAKMLKTQAKPELQRDAEMGANAEKAHGLPNKEDRFQENPTQLPGNVEHDQQPTPEEEIGEDFEQGYEATLLANGAFHSRSPLFISQPRANQWLQQEILKLKAQGKQAEGQVKYARVKALDTSAACDRMPSHFSVRAHRSGVTLLEGLAMDRGLWFVRNARGCRMFHNRKEAEGFLEYLRPTEVVFDKV